MTKRLTEQQYYRILDLYYDYEINELIKYVDELCEYNFKQGMTLPNTNNANQVLDK